MCARVVMGGKGRGREGVREGEDNHRRMSVRRHWWCLSLPANTTNNTSEMSGWFNESNTRTCVIEGVLEEVKILSVQCTWVNG